MEETMETMEERTQPRFPHLGEGKGYGNKVKTNEQVNAYMNELTKEKEVDNGMLDDRTNKES